MQEGKLDRSRLLNNPFFVIGAACLLGLVMTFIGLMLYYNSDTRRTVEQIQQNNEQLADSPLINNSEEISETYINKVETDITNLIKRHPDDTELNPSELTDSALGL
jgi:hypothetical protein